MIEIEYKFQLAKEALSNLQGKLEKLYFTNKGRLYEKTTMYDNPDNLMQRTNGRIRIRNVGEVQVEFSYKKPLPSDGGPKKEIEYEVSLEQGSEALKHIVEHMGFHETTSYERYRTTFTNATRTIKVTLDEFPFANFIEVEGDEKDVTKTAEALGFRLADHLNKSCDTLFTEWRAERGLPMTNHMRFEDYDK